MNELIEKRRAQQIKSMQLPSKKENLRYYTFADDEEAVHHKKVKAFISKSMPSQPTTIPLPNIYPRSTNYLSNNIKSIRIFLEETLQIANRLSTIVEERLTPICKKLSKTDDIINRERLTVRDSSATPITCCWC